MHRCLFIAAFFGFTLAVTALAQEGPKNSVVLIIRHVIHRLPAAPVGGELQPRTGARAGAGDEQKPSEPIVDRHPRIDNDGGRFENGPPAFLQ